MLPFGSSSTTSIVLQSAEAEAAAEAETAAAAETVAAAAEL